MEYLVTLTLSCFVIVLIFKKKKKREKTKFESVNVKSELKKWPPAQNTKNLIPHYALDFQKKLMPGCWAQDS